MASAFAISEIHLLISSSPSSVDRAIANVIKSRSSAVAALARTKEIYSVEN